METRNAKVLHAARMLALTLMLALAASFSMGAQTAYAESEADVTTGGCGIHLWYSEGGASVALRSYSGSETQVILPTSVSYGGKTYKAGDESNWFFVESGAFSGNTKVTKIAVPDGYGAISTGAFEGCTGLTEVAIGDSVSNISPDAFKGCANLKSYYIKGENVQQNDIENSGIGTDASGNPIAGVTVWTKEGSNVDKAIQELNKNRPDGKKITLKYDSDPYSKNTVTPSGSTAVKVAIPTGKTFTYSGKAQVGVAAGAGYTLSGTTSAINVGTYTVNAKLKTGYQWSDGTTGAKKIIWTISKASIAKITVTGLVNRCATGKAITQSPSVELSLGGSVLALKEGTDYTLSYKNNVKVGTATVTIKGKGNYKGSVTKKFKITKAAVDVKKVTKVLEDDVNAIKKSKSIAKIAAAKIKTTAKSKSKQMVITIPAVKNASNYIVAYKKVTAKSWTYYMTGGKNTYAIKGLKSGDLLQFKVAATKDGMRGNWSSVSYRYYKGPSKVKVTASAGGFTASWAKDAKATGYQVRYSTNKSMKGAKLVTVKNAKTVKRVVKGLKAGTTYYVQVRPVKAYKGKSYIGVLSGKKKVTVPGSAAALQA